MELPLTEGQQEAEWLLKMTVLSSNLLLEKCKLEYGHHNVTSIVTFGNLDKLPTEVQHLILENLDIRTLLLFRRVSQKAMATIDEMTKFKKIMKYAANTIRMAIGIYTAHTFTLAQLYAKLCQHLCDSGCGKPAPYFDVFTLSRRCLWVGGRCDSSSGPLQSHELTLNCFQSTSVESGDCKEPYICPGDIPSFCSIPGPCSARSGSLWEMDCRTEYYDYAKAKVFLEARGFRIAHSAYKNRRTRLDYNWLLSAVLAPFLNEMEMAPTHATFCDQCWTQEMTLFHDLNDKIVPSLLSRGRMLDNIAYGTVHWLAQHARERHTQ